jgi:hypothetical protein
LALEIGFFELWESSQIGRSISQLRAAFYLFVPGVSNVSSAASEHSGVRRHDRFSGPEAVVPVLVFASIPRHEFRNRVILTPRRFLHSALANPDNRPPRVFSVDGYHTDPPAIRELRNAGEFVTKGRYRRTP